MAARDSFASSGQGSWARLVVGLLAAVAVCTSTGCLGPYAVKQTRMRYNDAYRHTNDEQFLTNIVRLRYADSPVFVDLPNITAQFEVAGTGSLTGGRDSSGPGDTLLGLGEPGPHVPPSATTPARASRSPGPCSRP